MKLIIVISLVIVSVNCGLLDNLLEKEDPKNDNVIKKVVTTLKEDGKVVVDVLSAPFKKNANKKDADDKEEEKAATVTTPETKEVEVKPTEASTPKAEVSSTAATPDTTTKVTPAVETTTKVDAAPPKPE